MFCKNVGTADRAIRAIVGLGLISLTQFGPQTEWGWLGLIPLGTAVLSFCPAYLPFKLNTGACCAPKTGAAAEPTQGGSCCCGTGGCGDKKDAV